MTLPQRSLVFLRVMTLEVVGSQEAEFKITGEHYAASLAFVTDEGATYNIDTSDKSTHWWVSEEQILQALKDDGILQDSFEVEQLEFEHLDECECQISEAETRKPLFELKYQASIIIKD